MRMEEDQKMSAHLFKLIAVVNQLKTYGETIVDQQVVKKVMRSLTSRFYFVVVVIQEPKDLMTMKIEELLNTLETHEHVMINREA